MSAEIWNTSLRHNGKQKKMLSKKKKMFAKKKKMFAKKKKKSARPMTTSSINGSAFT